VPNSYPKNSEGGLVVVINVFLGNVKTKSFIFTLILNYDMDIDCLPYKNTGYFSKFICDYLDQKEGFKPFYNRFPTVENFKDQIREKATGFPDANRVVLNSALLNQYKGFQVSESTQANIEQLKETNTFTIVTGHQLNLFTGPLYFLYKIISTINLTRELKEQYPKYNFVPVYWMATEDHDFDEINYFNFKGKKVRWNREASGAVGHLETDALSEVYTIFANGLGGSKNAEALKSLFRLIQEKSIIFIWLMVFENVL